MIAVIEVIIPAAPAVVERIVGLIGPQGATGAQGPMGPGTIIATGVGGSANTITATATGLVALSSTPQLVWLIPVSTCSGPVTIDFNSLGAVDVVSPQGAALATGELIAATPYLLAVTASSARIFTSGAIW